jgi:peptidoglycan/LPS O-acetylase OafA/YrhL
MPSTTFIGIQKPSGDSKPALRLLKDLHSSPSDSRYLPQLDGVRALAILLVLMCHDIDTIASVPILPAVANVGWIGVDLFFVLSGFLITSNLIRGERSWAFLRSFYTRRALRIWPLYFGLLLVSFVYQELVGFRQHVPWGYCMLLVQNFWPVHLVKALKATWSLCIEEHYYLVWPLLVLALPKRWLPYLLGFLFLCMPVMRIWGVSMGLSGKALKTFTPFHLDGILLGSLIAVVLSLWKPGHRTMCWSGILLMVGGGLVAVPLLSRYLDDVAQTAVWAYWWVGLAMAGLVLLLIGSPPTRWWTRIFSGSSMVYVGKISYGIYLLHDLTFAFLDKLSFFKAHHASWVLSLCVFSIRVLVAIGIASLSW